MSNKELLLCLGFVSQLMIAQRPIVYMDLPALLGNRLWGFCVAKILAHELNYDLHCKSIYGFPNTYQYTPDFPSNMYPWQVHQHDQDIDIASMVANKVDRNIKIHGYFQKYAYIEKYADLIRKDWLKIDPALMHEVDQDDIVVHVRIHVQMAPLRWEYYEKALSKATFKRLYICTNEPNHPFMKNFESYNPIMVSTREFESYFHHLSWDETSKLNIDEFAFIASFNKIITSYSTYSWWAAFLSNATEIYAPHCRGFYANYGKVNEDRYIYIDADLYFRDNVLFD